MSKVFDLDAWVPDPDDLKEPFVFKLNGIEFTMQDPRDAADWQELTEANLMTVFYRSLGDEQAEEFVKIKLKTRRFSELTDRFAKHFGFVGPDGRPAGTSGL